MISLGKFHPDLLSITREVVRANASDGVFFKRGETPVDQMLIPRSERGAGGQLHFTQWM
jgi:hypothetical protein